MQYHRKPCHRYIWWLYIVYLYNSTACITPRCWPVVVVKWIKVQHKGLLGKFSLLSKYTLSIINCSKFWQLWQQLSAGWLHLSPSHPSPCSQSYIRVYRCIDELRRIAPHICRRNQLSPASSCRKNIDSSSFLSLQAPRPSQLWLQLWLHQWWRTMMADPLR